MIVDILLPAFIISLLICALHVPLGLEVLKRGIIFIDLAIAQIAGLGVVVAKLFFVHASNLSVQISAFVFALGAAGLFKYTEKIIPQYQEAVIGSVYIVASALALLLLANHPHGGEEIQAMLAGQILWVDWTQIAIAASVFAVILVFLNRFKEKYFYFIFAGVVTFSVQLVGIYLVFASLILPALGAVAYKNKLKTGYVIAFSAFLMGMGLSVMTDSPMSLIIVCTLAGVSFLAALFRVIF